MLQRHQTVREVWCTIAVAEREAAEAEVATAQARHAESIKEGEELDAMLQQCQYRTKNKCCCKD